MATQYRVDLAFPVSDMTAWRQGSDACAAAAGDVPCDAGTGFGERDMQFYFATKTAAEAALARLQATGLPFVYLKLDECEADNGD